MPKLVPCLWFDNEAEEAARFYVSVFKNARIDKITRYGAAGTEVHGQREGTVLTVEFEIEGQKFTALNGGPQFKFTEAVSFQHFCDTQAEVDALWHKLAEGGEIQQCGWLKDKFGLSWQIIPTALPRLMNDPDRRKAERVMQAMLAMKKIEIDKLQQAYDGETSVAAE